MGFSGYHRADYDNTLAKLLLSDSGCLTGVIKNYTSQSGTVLQNGNFLTVNHLNTRNRISFVPSVMFSFSLPWFLVTLRRKFQFKSCATAVCLFPLKISTENWGATAQNWSSYSCPAFGRCVAGANLVEQNQMIPASKLYDNGFDRSQLSQVMANLYYVLFSFI